MAAMTIVINSLVSCAIQFERHHHFTLNREASEMLEEWPQCINKLTCFIRE